MGRLGTLSPRRAPRSRLPDAPLEPSAPATVAPAWRFDGAGEAVVPAGRVALVVLRDGGGVVALDPRTGAERWRFSGRATAAAADGEFVAAGLESGDVVLLDDGGAERRRFAADSAGVSRDVRALAFCGGRVAAATARAVTVADAATGAVVERVACDETVNALAGGRLFAAATRTGVRVFGGGDHASRGAVLAAAASGDAVAAGCIDRKVRVFFPGGRRREWTGFSSAVERLAWSASGTWLAAVGGRAVALRRDLPPGEAPVGVPRRSSRDFDPGKRRNIVAFGRRPCAAPSTRRWMSRSTPRARTGWWWARAAASSSSTSVARTTRSRGSAFPSPPRRRRAPSRSAAVASSPSEMTAPCSGLSSINASCANLPSS